MWVQPFADREAATLRGALASQIAELFQQVATLYPERWEQLGDGVAGPVVAALRKVPRHLFTPGVPLARAYEDVVVVPNSGASGAGLTSVSQPSMIAWMLAQLDVRPGQSVLKVGSGGYQAALLRELVGPDGSVTTLDIAPDVISRARACLDRAGYGDVRTVCADGEYGAPGHGPFDKIIVAVQAWDIPPAWTGQLAPGGRLVVPLLTRGCPGHGRWTTRTGTWSAAATCQPSSCRCRAPGSTTRGRSRWTSPA